MHSSVWHASISIKKLYISAAVFQNYLFIYLLYPIFLWENEL